MFYWLDQHDIRAIEIVMEPGRKMWGDLTYYEGTNSDYMNELIASTQIDRSRSAFRYSANMLEPCFVEERYDYMIGVINLAAELGFHYVTGNLGSVPGADWETNLLAIEQHFLPILDYAKTKEITIAVENCPHEGTNLATNPKNWREILKTTEDYSNFGIEFDPSHLLWLMLDPYKFVQEFGEKILIMHAKDTILFRDRLVEEGILGEWWEYRLPGQGELDWVKIYSDLEAINFSGPIYIEREDNAPPFNDTTDARLDGILYARDYLNNISTNNI
jgi:sugar phosphate isomerase/epimerase